MAFNIYKRRQWVLPAPGTLIDGPNARAFIGAAWYWAARWFDDITFSNNTQIAFYTGEFYNSSVTLSSATDFQLSATASYSSALTLSSIADFQQSAGSAYYLSIVLPSLADIQFTLAAPPLEGSVTLSALATFYVNAILDREIGITKRFVSPYKHSEFISQYKDQEFLSDYKKNIFLSENKQNIFMTLDV